MTIHHVAIWANDLEVLKNFYVSYFNAMVGARYHNFYLTWKHGCGR